MTPLVDVVIPVRNAGRLLKRAVDSVLDQTVDCNVYVVDDDSTDGATDRLPRDRRIAVVKNAGSGIPAALDTGIALGDSPYIARQDADDESLPGRFVAQLAHLEENDGIGMVGTHFEVIAGGRVLTTMRPTVDGLLKKNPFCAGSVMARRGVMRAAGGHRGTFALSSDYDMWLRCARIAGVSILPIIGYRYRLTAGMASVREASRQAAYADLARASALAALDGREDPVNDMTALDTDKDTDVAVNMWWAREFAALGAWRDAASCFSRVPKRQRPGLAARIARHRAPQAHWT